MDLSFSPDEEAFRADCRAWLDANVPRPRCPSGDTREGFAAHLGWERAAVRRAVRRRVVARGLRRTRREPLGVADLRGGVLPGRRAATGHPERHLPARSDDLRVRYARAAVAHPRAHGFGRTGPGARAGRSRTPAATSPGSRAGPCRDDAGGGWRLSGQKTWTTRARSARTCSDCSAATPTPSATRASRTSSCDLESPGVTVRGFERLDGDEGFAEVFLDDVFVSDTDVLGEPNQGWAVAMATTGSERGLTLRSPGRFLATAQPADRPVSRAWRRSRDPGPSRRGVHRRRGISLADLLDRDPRRRRTRARARSLRW